MGGWWGGVGRARSTYIYIYTYLYIYAFLPPQESGGKKVRADVLAKEGARRSISEGGVRGGEGGGRQDKEGKDFKRQKLVNR